MTPTSDQYDNVVDKIDAADKLAQTGLDTLALGAIGFAVLLLGVSLWFALRVAR